MKTQISSHLSRTTKSCLSDCFDLITYLMLHRPPFQGQPSMDGIDASKSWKLHEWSRFGRSPPYISLKVRSLRVLADNSCTPIQTRQRTWIRNCHSEHLVVLRGHVKNFLLRDMPCSTCGSSTHCSKTTGLTGWPQEISPLRRLRPSSSGMRPSATYGTHMISRLEAWQNHREFKNWIFE